MEQSESQHTCPLCDGDTLVRLDATFKKRAFYLCKHCYLISSDRSSLPNVEEEKSRYMQHINTSEDQGYLSFLHQVIDPLLPFLRVGANGLDYGCGPSPVLAEILVKLGFGCKYYDPFFYPIDIVDTFDFVTATECFEHFHQPKKDLNHLIEILGDEGILAVMTDTWTSLDVLGVWHYIRDLTHVSFYHAHTMDWIANKYCLDLLYTDNKRVFIFQRLGK